MNDTRQREIASWWSLSLSFQFNSTLSVSVYICGRRTLLFFFFFVIVVLVAAILCVHRTYIYTYIDRAMKYYECNHLETEEHTHVSSVTLK